MKKKIVVGTRGSKLALWQTHHIKALIEAQYPNLEVEVKHIVTTGDKILDVALSKIGEKGLFTKEIEIALLNGEIDFAVHSLKDMPTELPEGLILSAITERVDSRDVFISRKYKSIDELPVGAKIGTSSLRRQAQLLNYRSDLKIADLRGNIDTRLKKLDSEGFDAIILANAGLERLELAQDLKNIIPMDIILPAVGQGALAIESRANDAEVTSILEFLNHYPTRYAVEAERAFLNELEGGCQVPMGVHSEMLGEQIELQAVILSPNGERIIRDFIEGHFENREELGRKLAKRMFYNGGKDILAELERLQGEKN